MSYGNFTLGQVTKTFNLGIVERLGMFAAIASSAPSEHFAETLRENLPLAVAINTEKARSELLVVNVLVEIRKQFDRNISFFSGIEFNVDRALGLTGYCDFIVSLASEQLFLQAPAIAIVEAKNENITSGLGQCLAEMVAVRMFNEREGTEIEVAYGTVTSGVAWKFLKLAGDTAYIDLSDYSIESSPGKILGILSAMVAQTA